MAAIYQQPPANVVFMPPQQAQQGTLVPGQTISLKTYTVTVERYLSQGGFAHVYLVRSAMPINGTTSHVLKRIAVSDDVMLREVQKEVDVMKVLREHPCIVRLIDSTSYQHPNGTYEVFILMEYCSGGGIIDMMNRRLRERLKEHEILQIFVDVLEGVAFMHNLKPALLHRDLKVENILQSSERSFKLCDFGSAATAALKPPSTTAELRALEEDVLRHTTLQYRAPEMVDIWSRQPIDEKSDVWALGVLLYKLCYYTTPFEEHGPSSILEVRYKIPPYPVYSANMTNLIASMLQKSGTMRPTAFELLDTVHRLRGTRPLYSYNPTPSIFSPSAFSSTAQTFNTNATPSFKTGIANSSAFGSANSGGYSYNVSQSYPSRSPVPAIAKQTDGPTANTATSAAAARQHVLAAIQPMRRGRPIAAPPISPRGTMEGSVYSPASAATASPDDVYQQTPGRQETATATDAPTTTGSLLHTRGTESKYGQRQQLSDFGVQSVVQPESVRQQRQLTASRFRNAEEFGVTEGARFQQPSQTTGRAGAVNDPATSTGLPARNANATPTVQRPATTPSADADVGPYGREALLGAWELRKGGSGSGTGGLGSGSGSGGPAAFDGFADSFDFVGRDGRDANLGPPMKASTPIGQIGTPVSNTLSAFTRNSGTGNALASRSTVGKKDAFEGLTDIVGFSQKTTPPITMGAAALASASLNTPTVIPSRQLSGNRSSPLLSPPSPGLQSRSSPASDLSIEERFPSIEEYERRSPGPAVSGGLSPPSTTNDWRKAPSLAAPPPRPTALTPQPTSPTAHRQYYGSSVLNGTRSQHTTGTAMKDAEAQRGSMIRAGSSFTTYKEPLPSPESRYLARRQSLTVPRKSTGSVMLGKAPEPALPPRPGQKKAHLNIGTGPRKPTAPPKDWLTGDETPPAQTSPTATATATTTSTGATGLTRRRSAQFIRRASAFGEVAGVPRRSGASPAPPASVTATKPDRKETESSSDEDPEDPVRTRSRFLPRPGGSIDVVAPKPSVPLVSKRSTELFGKRQDSMDLMDFKGPPTTTSASITGKLRAESPGPVPTLRPKASHQRFPTSGQSPPQVPSNKPPTTEPRRPQSMFISPTPSTLAPPKPVTAESALEPESPTSPPSPTKMRRPRRNSVVDIVSKFEALEAAAAGPRSAGPPPIAPKPSGLQSTGGSHTRARASLDIPKASLPQRTRKDSTPQRKSVSPQGRKPPPAALDTRAPSPVKALLSPVVFTSPRAVTPPPPSPSPERPYVGVASLINQWQKKSEESKQSPKPSPRWK